MEKLIKALQEMNKQDIGKDNKVVLDVLKKAYPDNELLRTKVPKRALFNIWESVIQKAAKPKDASSISRIWIRLYQALDPVIKALYPNENTSEGVFVAFRKPIRKKYGDASQVYIKSTHLMGVSRERALQRREEAQNKADAKASNRKNLPLYYDDEIYSVIDKCINSTNPHDRIIAVQLCTGSRYIEVLKVSTYTAHDEPDWIRIKGIAKDRGSHNYANKVVIRPLIHSNSSQIIAAVKYIRESLKINEYIADLKKENAKIDNEQINSKITSKYNSSTNKRLKTYFKQPGTTTHRLRYLASRLAYLLYGQNSVENLFIQTFLGHIEGTVSRRYQSVNVRLRANESKVDADEVLPRLSKLNYQIEEEQKARGKLQKSIREIEATVKATPVRAAVTSGTSRIFRGSTEARYSQYINPNVKSLDKIDILTNLAKQYKKDRIAFPAYAVLKRDYKYGSATVTEFLKKIRSGEIKI
jgi:hypothetical protein